MTFLQIVPSSIIASISHYHRIYLICRIHAIHKYDWERLPASVPIQSLIHRSINRSTFSHSWNQTTPAFSRCLMADYEDLGVAMIEKELHDTRNRPDTFRAYFGPISGAAFATPSFVLNHQTSQSSCFFMLTENSFPKQADCSLTISFSGPTTSPHFRETGP